ncbi:metal-dependent transcriptional regulator [Candidatus Altiarchaeota archaeon]
MPKKISRSSEDYLETIYVINQRKGYARTNDIAHELGIAASSVTEMLQKLNSLDLVSYKKHAPVTLTQKGAKLAKATKTRHDTLTKLLKIINVSDKIADSDACKMEHELSSETLEQLSKFVKFVESSSDCPKWLEHFKEYCETGTWHCKQIK